MKRRPTQTQQEFINALIDLALPLIVVAGVVLLAAGVTWICEVALALAGGAR